MNRTSTKLGVIVLLFLQLSVSAQQKRIYLSNDDHTDYMWAANEAGYQTAFLQMLDWWINYNETTATNPAPYRSKWNCDGSFWVSVYEKNRSAAQFNKLIDQIRSGQITVPYSPLIVTYGAVPAEAALRGMYYAGDLERRYNLDFDMAIAVENQTLPLGLSSLWKGAGAKYCWHGVCDCYTLVTNLTNRQNEIYWYKGIDTNKILLKWYNLQGPGQNADLGGYGEARFANTAISNLAAKCNTTLYPFNIAAGFGVGWDDLQTTSDNLVAAAQANTNASQQIIVSNEVDFFRDFENTYGAALPNVTQTFGNEWDLACASIAEVSAKMKRSLEKLRAAEAMAAIVIKYNPTFAVSLDIAKKEAWTALGLYWEHDFGFAGTVSLEERNAFQRRLETSFSSYTDQLYNLAKNNLGNLITNSSANIRFFAFNPLGWSRTDYADYAYSGSTNIHVYDVSANTEVPFQMVTKNGVNYLRIAAANIPSLGYKVYEIRNGPGSVVFSNAGTNTGNIVENDFFRITYTNQGVLTSIIDKQNSNRNIAALTNGKYINDLGTGLANNGTAVVENNGPVTITILTTTSAAPLAHSTRITLFKNVPRIEIDNQITEGFNSIRTWSYSFNISSAEVWHEETGAVIKAKLTSNAANPGNYATQNARYDWNTLNHFASVNETNYGVTLSNQDCYFMNLGNSNTTFLDQNSAQLNILAGGKIDGIGINNQGGDQLFNQRFAITTHTNYNAASEMKNALEHQNFMVCGTINNQTSFLPFNQYSYLSINNAGAVIWAVKPAEEGSDNGIITRVWNLNNTDVATNLTFNLPINEAMRTTHVETNMNSNSFSGKDLQAAIGQNEMKTYRVKLFTAALPLELTSFTGEKVQQLNVLKWKTANEINIKKYELERSSDGQQFAGIAIVPSKSEIGNSYDFKDHNINTTSAYYYRLKIINADNSFSYSFTIIIRPGKEASDLLLYPNPVADVLKINFLLDKKTRCNIAVINSAGVVVKTVAPPLFERGNNYYSLSLKDLPAGEYIFSLTAGDKKYIKGFIKQ
ncbi:glycosyl hydrolase-related protein [Ferruginibacter sp.]